MKHDFDPQLSTREDVKQIIATIQFLRRIRKRESVLVKPSSSRHRQLSGIGVKPTHSNYKDYEQCISHLVVHSLWLIYRQNVSALK